MVGLFSCAEGGGVSRDPTNPTDVAKKNFLKSLRRYGNITKVAKAARIDRSTPYRWREDDPDAAYDAPLEEAADYLEAESYRQAEEAQVKKR